MYELFCVIVGVPRIKILLRIVEEKFLLDIDPCWKKKFFRGVTTFCHVGDVISGIINVKIKFNIHARHIYQNVRMHIEKKKVSWTHPQIWTWCMLCDKYRGAVTSLPWENYLKLIQIQWFKLQILFNYAYSSHNFVEYFVIPL